MNMIKEINQVLHAMAVSSAASMAAPSQAMAQTSSEARAAPSSDSTIYRWTVMVKITHKRTILSV